MMYQGAKIIDVHTGVDGVQRAEIRALDGSLIADGTYATCLQLWYTHVHPANIVAALNLPGNPKR